MTHIPSPKVLLCSLPSLRPPTSLTPQQPQSMEQPLAAPLSLSSPSISYTGSCAANVRTYVLLPQQNTGCLSAYHEDLPLTPPSGCLWAAGRDDSPSQYRGVSTMEKGDPLPFTQEIDDGGCEYQYTNTDMHCVHEPSPDDDGRRVDTIAVSPPSTSRFPAKSELSNSTWNPLVPQTNENRIRSEMYNDVLSTSPVFELGITTASHHPTTLQNTPSNPRVSELCSNNDSGNGTVCSPSRSRYAHTLSFSPFAVAELDDTTRYPQTANLDTSAFNPASPPTSQRHASESYIPRYGRH